MTYLDRLPCVPDKNCQGRPLTHSANTLPPDGRVHPEISDPPSAGARQHKPPNATNDETQAAKTLAEESEGLAPHQRPGVRQLTLSPGYSCWALMTLGSRARAAGRNSIGNPKPTA